MAQRSTLLGKLLRLCHRNYFEVSEKPTVHEYDRISLNLDGPLGTIFRRNIENEWWMSNVIAAENAMFAASSNRVALRSSPKLSDLEENDLTNYFNRVSKLVRNKLPFGFASCGPFQPDTREQTILKSSRDLNHVTALNTELFVPPNATRWFHESQRSRLVWWKKFAVTPANFSASPVVRSEDGRQVVSILYAAPWGTESVEEIRDSLPSEDLGSKASEGLVGSIRCSTTVEAAALAYLLDAVKEKTRGTVRKTVLHVHHRLAPYKTAITVVGSPSSATSLQLNHLVQFVRGDLKKAGIMIMQVPDMMSFADEEQNSMYDEMGIPFNIVLDEQTLKNGIVGLRSRDTSLREQVHVSEIKERLRRYLQMQ